MSEAAKGGTKSDKAFGMARVLIACEFSGIVRRAFAARGHDAWSCDLLPAEDRSNKHLQCDVREVLDRGWELLIVAHPPCTRLCNSGVRWLHRPPRGKSVEQMWGELDEGAELFSALWNAPIPRRCVENPVMHKHAKSRIRATGNRRRQSNRGSLATRRASGRVCGCTTYHRWRPP